ncbi:MAG: NAD(P)-dependent oxidoreductase [bacterium]
MKKIKAAFFDIREFEVKHIDEVSADYLELVKINEPFQNEFDNRLDDIKDIEILSVFTTSTVIADSLKKLPNLKLIITRSTGFNHIDSDYCKQNNIILANVAGYGETTVAEFAFGLLLTVMRKITHAYNSLQKRVINIHGFMGNDLFGKTIGVIGTGAIGSHFIQISKGFGMNVIASDPYPKQALVDKFDVKYVSLEELYKQSDIISVHCPGTKENHHLLSNDQFDQMKEGVIIINTARGELIDTDALYKAVTAGKIGGAGLDVLECEDILMQEDKYLLKIDCIKEDCLRKTLLNHKLLELDNVVITPHVAYDTIEAVNRILDKTYATIDKFYKGEEIKSVY